MKYISERERERVPEISRNNEHKESEMGWRETQPKSWSRIDSTWRVNIGDAHSEIGASPAVSNLYD